ncbi:TlpA disulfide reductase family protein [Methylococcus sp. EFPC2]|uniref:TlpA family protein disulfide reductase n=1 Tax=Methylococcus sp. EFPC2 TaxID=2812648 RepID=UPI0019671D60|nr:TlpA disulfide reductase family protein [Methylococcus sp. EFPC2]QSA97032.1 TlpA family protein disulfide reductase [Methylococcus sp. EFPC2]
MTIRKIALSTLLLLLGAAPAYALREGAPAPACPANLASADQKFNLSAYRGKVVLLDFWATWCGPCKKSMPFLNGLHKQHLKDGFEVVAINVDESTDEALEFLKAFPVEYNLAFNPGGECPRVFDVQAMPSSFLIDRQGKIRTIHLGFRDGDEVSIRKHVEALLAE